MKIIVIKILMLQNLKQIRIKIWQNLAPQPNLRRNEFDIQFSIFKNTITKP